MKYIFFSFVLFILLVHSVWLTGAELSVQNRLWLRENLIKPKPEMTFTVTVDRQMIDPGAVVSDTSGNRQMFQGMSEKELAKHLEANPLQAEGYIQLNRSYQAAGKYEQANGILKQGLKKLFQSLDADPGNWKLAQGVQQLYRSVHQEVKAQKIAAVFLERNPDSVEALLDTTKVAITSGNLALARQQIDRVYTLAPRSSDLYLCELLYQLFYGQQAVVKEGAFNETTTWPADYTFFQKAVREHPDLPSSRVAMHGLQILQAFYSGVLRNYTRLGRLEFFEFSLDEPLVGRLRAGKTFFQQEVENSHVDPYFRSLCLFLAALVENDPVHAERLYQELQKRNPAVNDLYRLMTIGDLARGNITEAVKRMQAALANQDNAHDRIMLAWLYQSSSNLAAGLDTLMAFQGPLTQDILTQRVGYGLLSTDPAEGVRLYREYRQFKPLWQNRLFVYYAAVAEMLAGNLDQGQEYLHYFPADSNWYQSGQAISKHLAEQ